MRTACLAAAAALAALAAPLAPAPAGGALWDLLVDAGVEGGEVPAGAAPAVSGAVTDHAGDPVAGAEVTVRTAGRSNGTVTGPDGRFSVSFGGAPLDAGDHAFTVRAELGGLRGLSTGVYSVEGESFLTPTARALSTAEAARYLAASPDDFGGDPVGTSLYNHYQRLYAVHMAELERASELERLVAEQAERREAAANATRAALEEANPSAGTFSGIRYERFVAGYGPEARSSLEDQINYTMGTFEEAGAAMRGVLAAGGTYEEALDAYHSKARLSRAVMEAVLRGEAPEAPGAGAPENRTAPGAPDAPQPPPPPPPAPEEARLGAAVSGWGVLPLGERLDLSGAAIGLSPDGTILANVNGTLVRLQLLWVSASSP